MIDTAAAKTRLGVRRGARCCSPSAFCLLERASRRRIRAIPAIAAQRPEVLYVVLGATHPHLVAREGEGLFATRFKL